MGEGKNSYFTCHDCGRKLKSKHSLRRHTRTHRGPKQLACPNCDRKFTRKENVRRHLTQTCSKVKKTETKPLSFDCETCKKSFTKRFLLKRHLARQTCQRRINKEKERSTGFRCEGCRKCFNKKSLLNRHIRRQKCRYFDKECPLCHFKDRTENVLNHFTAVHGIEIKCSELSFPSMDEFYAWKRQMEATTYSRFIVKQKPNSFFFCHRSGYFVSRSKGIRHIKMKGSNKINGYCPAKLVLKHNDDGSVIAKFTETHIGHDLDIERITLTQEERENIASKIQAKVPFDSILDEIRSPNSEHLTRINLLKRKDLYNIEKYFNLAHDSIRHKNDASSVDAWVNEIKSTGEHSNQIRLYKPSGVVMEGLLALNRDDFAIILMTDLQKEILNAFANTFICVDSTHGITSLLILDETQRCLPCAFFISNRFDFAALKIFFETIRNELKPIQTHVFMSDMGDLQFRAWTSVMPPVAQRIYCPWDLDRAWRKGLYKIRKPELRAEVYRQLRVIMLEPDPNAFSSKLITLQQQLDENPLTLNFGQFFKDYCEESVFRCWANCYRQCIGINNDNLERMHKSLKRTFTMGKNNKRLDKAINYLQKLFDDRTSDRVITYETHEKEKDTPKVLEFEPQQSVISNVIETGNVIKKFYWIDPSNSDLSYAKLSCNCNLICAACNYCMHACKCTVNEIHLSEDLVDDGALDNQHEPDNASPPVEELVIDEIGNRQEEEFIFQPLNNAEPIPTLEERITILTNEVALSLASITSLQQFEAVKQITDSILPTIRSIKESEGLMLNQEQEEQNHSSVSGH